MNNGWIKLHRKILENPIMKRPTWLQLWITLLLMANHKENSAILNGQVVVIKEGQLLTGRDALSEATGIHRSSIERILNFLEIEHQIEQQKTTKYRLITILNWKEYQEKDSNPSNKRATNEQQMSTNKNVKKVKNDKKDTSDAEASGNLVNEFIKLFGGINPSYDTLFKRKAQRQAAERLLQKNNLDWWTRFMEAYIKVLGEDDGRFCPKATTPQQMEDKLAGIMAFGHTRKSNGKGREIISTT